MELKAGKKYQVTATPVLPQPDLGFAPPPLKQPEDYGNLSPGMTRVCDPEFRKIPGVGLARWIDIKTPVPRVEGELESDAMVRGRTKQTIDKGYGTFEGLSRAAAKGARLRRRLDGQARRRAERALQRKVDALSFEDTENVKVAQTVITRGRELHTEVQQLHNVGAVPEVKKGLVGTLKRIASKLIP